MCFTFGVFGQILKDERKREQYDYAMACAEELAPFYPQGQIRIEYVICSG